MLDFISSEQIHKHPVYLLPLGILAVTIGMLFGALIFRDIASFPAIFLTSVAVAPLIMELVKMQKIKNISILNKYKEIIEDYSYLFFGMSIGFAVWYAVLPSDLSSMMFSEQLSKIGAGYFTGATALFMEIVINNLSILFAFFILSVVFGFGSLFLLAWNASILGLMWGNVLKSLINISNSGNLVINTLLAFPYLLPEVLAYFIAAIAGVIVSIKISKKGETDAAISDSMKLLIASIILIIIGGAIEAVILS